MTMARLGKDGGRKIKEGEGLKLHENEGEAWPCRVDSRVKERGRTVAKTRLSKLALRHKGGWYRA